MIIAHAHRSHPRNKKARKQADSSPPFDSLSVRRPVADAAAAHVPLHVGDVVEFGHVAVFLHVGALVLGHAGDEVVDDLVRDERVTKVKFGDVGLGRGCKRATHTIRDRSDNSPCRRQLL